MDFMRRLDEVHCLATPCLHLVDNISRIAYSITLPSHVYQHCASQLRHCLGELDFYLSPTIFTENPQEVAEVIVYNSEVRGWINRLKVEYERLTILSRAGSRKKEFDHRVGECLKLLTAEDSAAKLKEVIIKDLEGSKKIDPYYHYKYSTLEPLFEEMSYVSVHYSEVLASRLRQTASSASKSNVEEVAGDADGRTQGVEQRCSDDVAIGVDEGHSLITGVMSDSILPVADNYAAAKENPMYNTGKEWK
uniref:p28 protein n=1 Tax=Blueberry virus A TaxID=1206566 RepID=T1YXB9_9CLOS|nr:p28 protein [Blueberry virus A]QYU71611.1 p28 protein [Blueberry virus A]